MRNFIAHDYDGTDVDILRQASLGGVPPHRRSSPHYPQSRLTGRRLDLKSRRCRRRRPGVLDQLGHLSQHRVEQFRRPSKGRRKTQLSRSEHRKRQETPSHCMEPNTTSASPNTFNCTSAVAAMSPSIADAAPTSGVSSNAIHRGPPSILLPSPLGLKSRMRTRSAVSAPTKIGIPHPRTPNANTKVSRMKISARSWFWTFMRSMLHRLRRITEPDQDGPQ